MNNFIKSLFREEKLNSVMVVAIFLLLSIWWMLIYFIGGGTDLQLNNTWSAMYQVVAVLGGYIGLLIFFRSSRHQELGLPRAAILFFALGLLFQAIGQTVYTIYVFIFNVEVAYPSLADIFYLGSVPLYLAGIILLYFTVIEKKDWVKTISWSIFCLIVISAAEIWFLRATGFALDGTLRPPVDIAYFVIQTIYSALALGAYLGTKGFADKKFRFGYSLIVFGLVLQYLIDFYFSYAARLDTWINGGVGEYTYLFTYFVMALALVQFTTLFIAINILVVIFNSFFIFLFLLSGTPERFFSNGFLLIICWIVSYFLLRRNKEELLQREKLVRFDALEESHRRLVELDQQKTEFLTIAAHHLRTPVSIIKNYIAMLQDGDYGPVNKEVKTVHNNIGESAERLVKLTDDFLSITNLEHGEIKMDILPGDLRNPVWEAVNELKLKAEKKGLRLIVEDMPDSLTAEFDAGKIKHAVMNYLENAIKYTNKGSITVLAEKKNKGLALYVRDTGIGFNEEERDEFFQKFQRGQNAIRMEVNTSTGLGLYIVRKYIEAHNGKVWAKSEGEGRGSEFGFWLPLKQ